MVENKTERYINAYHGLRTFWLKAKHYRVFLMGWKHPSLGKGLRQRVPSGVCIGKDHSLEESSQQSCASNAWVTALQEQPRKHSVKIPFDNQCNLRVWERCAAFKRPSCFLEGTPTVTPGRACLPSQWQGSNTE